MRFRNNRDLEYLRNDRNASMSRPLPTERSLGQRLYRSPVLWVFLVTLVVLAIHPIPECIDCEGALGLLVGAIMRFFV